MRRCVGPFPPSIDLRFHHSRNAHTASAIPIPVENGSLTFEPFHSTSPPKLSSLFPLDIIGVRV